MLAGDVLQEELKQNNRGFFLGCYHHKRLAGEKISRFGYRVILVDQ